MITFQKEPYADEETYSVLCPLVRSWFSGKFAGFAAPQKYAIINIHRKQNTLVSAPTGSGKTLTAFLSVLNELIILSESGGLEDKVYCVYVSPLKALNNDIEKNLNEPLSEITSLAGRNLGIRVMVARGIRLLLSVQRCFRSLRIFLSRRLRLLPFFFLLRSSVCVCGTSNGL